MFAFLDPSPPFDFLLSEKLRVRKSPLHFVLKTPDTFVSYVLKLNHWLFCSILAQGGEVNDAALTEVCDRVLLFDIENTTCLIVHRYTIYKYWIVVESMQYILPVLPNSWKVFSVCRVMDKNSEIWDKECTILTHKTLVPHHKRPWQKPWCQWKERPAIMLHFWQKALGVNMLIKHFLSFNVIT